MKTIDAIVALATHYKQFRGMLEVSRFHPGQGGRMESLASINTLFFQGEKQAEKLLKALHNNNDWIEDKDYNSQGPYAIWGARYYFREGETPWSQTKLIGP